MVISLESRVISKDHSCFFPQIIFGLFSVSLSLSNSSRIKILLNRALSFCFAPSGPVSSTSVYNLQNRYKYYQHGKAFILVPTITPFPQNKSKNVLICMRYVQERADQCINLNYVYIKDSSLSGYYVAYARTLLYFQRIRMICHQSLTVIHK